MELSQVTLSRIEPVQSQQATQRHLEQQQDSQQRGWAREETRRVSAAVHQLNELSYSGPTRELTIRLDPKTQRPTVRIVDKETGEVVQQIPPEYVLRLAREAKERLRDGQG